MNNSSVATKYEDPDPKSALLFGIWLATVSTIGIPLNIFIVVVTVRIKEIRAVPSNTFIGSLALSDSLLMLCLWLHLPYALSSNETLCKMIGFGASATSVLGTCIPPFLSINRYAVVCRQQDKLARFLFKAFTRKGIYLMILLLWIFEFTYQLPFAMLDTLGLHAMGICTSINMWSNEPFIRIYYYCGMLFIYFLSYFPSLIFYRKVSAWVKSMSAQLLLSGEARETIRETESVLSLTKWVIIAPFLFSCPDVSAAALLEIDSKMIPLGIARVIVSSYPLIPFCNAIITIKFARPYRLALRKVCKRSAITLTLYSWIIEGRQKIDSTIDSNTLMIASRT